MKHPQEPVTRLLESARAGDDGAREALLTAVYAELRKRAQVYLKNERPGHTLPATALVHEAYVQLLDGDELPGQNRGQFLAYISQAMRHILVDHARSRRRIKRGGDHQRVELSESVAVSGKPDVDLLALDEALTSLARVDSRKSRVVELKYFGGLSVEETAEALGVSPGTVKNDWAIAKTWLLHELQKGESNA